MNKLKHALWLASLAVLFSACAAQKPVSRAGYTLNGSIAGAADGTWVYILNQDKFNSAPLSDSTQIRKGKFTLTGTVPNKAMLVLVGIKGPVYAADGKNVQRYRLTDAAPVWLENKVITFDGTKGSLYKTSGNIAQDYFRNNQAADDAAFISRNPDEYFSAYVLNVRKETWSRDQVAKLYALLSQRVKDSLYGRQLAEFLSLSDQ